MRLRLCWTCLRQIVQVCDGKWSFSLSLCSDYVSTHLHSPFHTHTHFMHTPPRDQAVYSACLCPHFFICTWCVGPLPLHRVSVGCCWIYRPGWTGAPLCCRVQVLLQMLLRLCWITHNVFWANTERYTLCKECVNIQLFHGVSSQLGGWKGNPNVLFFFFCIVLVCYVRSNGCFVFFLNIWLIFMLPIRYSEFRPHSD